MEAKFDWLFWIDTSKVSRVLYISCEDKDHKQMEVCDINFYFRSINTIQECKSICEEGEYYDLVYIQSLGIKEKDVFLKLGQLVADDGYFILATIRRDILSRFFKKTIFKHIPTENEDVNIGVDLKRFVDRKIFEIYEELYVYPSVLSPWTLSNTDIILRQMSWWKRSKNRKMLMIQKLFSISIFAQLCIRFWPETINLYRKIR